MSKKIFDIKPTKESKVVDLRKDISEPIVEKEVIEKVEPILAFEPEQVTEEPVVEKPKKPVKKKRAKKKKKPFDYKKLLFLFIPIGLTAFIVLTVLARVDVEVWPKTRVLSFEQQALVYADLSESNFSKANLTGRIFTLQQDLSDEFESTGTATEKAKATGKIKIVNNYNLNQILVEKTRFLSADGKLFYLINRVEIPAGSNLEVNVVAAESGTDYNIKPTSFSIPGLAGSARYTAIYAESSESMTGGSEKKVSQVTKQDLENASVELKEKLFSQAEQSFTEIAGDNFYLLPGAIQSGLAEETSSAEQDQASETFTYTVNIDSKALAVKKQDLDDFAKYVIANNIDENEDIDENSLILEPGVQKIDFEENKLYLNIVVSVNIYEKFDVQDLKQALVGKTIKQTRVFLSSFPEAEKTKLRILPFWVQKIPQDLERINVRVNID